MDHTHDENEFVQHVINLVGEFEDEWDHLQLILLIHFPLGVLDAFHVVVVILQNIILII